MRMRDAARRARCLGAVLLGATACLHRRPPATIQWAPIPVYAFGPDVATACGRAPESLPATITTTVDVLIDSLDRGELAELLVIVQPLPQWLRDRPTPVFGVTLEYPKPGVGSPRQAWSQCDVAKGATMRVNAAVIDRAGLVITSPGAVRVTVRSMDGTVLGVPVLLSPGMPVHTVRWALVKRAA